MRKLNRTPSVFLSTTRDLAHSTRPWIGAALAILLAAGCSEELPGAEQFDDLPTAPVTGNREIPGADAGADGSTGGTGGRPIPGLDAGSGGTLDAGTADVGTDMATDAGSGPTDEPPILPAQDVELIELEVPAAVDAQSNALHDGSWQIVRPSPDCAGSTSTVAFANGYRLSNAEPDDVEVRLSLRTAANGASLTLPDGTIFTYAAGALPDATASCVSSGATSPSFSSEVSGLMVPAGGSVEFLVAGAGPDETGSYQITVVREEADTPVTPDPGPGTPDDGTAGCTNTCAYAGDGTCDDGGPGSSFSLCELGSDCTDCGPRASTDPSPTDGLCSDSCGWAGDGVCDDGGPGSSFSACDLGTDCTDCGPRDGSSPSGMCTNTCVFAGDGDCDDGGPGSLFGFCDLGTDCADCGPR